MGANTTVYVKRLKLVEDWVEVSAQDLSDAEDIVSKMSDTAYLLHAQYEPNISEDF